MGVSRFGNRSECTGLLPGNITDVKRREQFVVIIRSDLVRCENGVRSGRSGSTYQPSKPLDVRVAEGSSIPTWIRHDSPRVFPNSNTEVADSERPALPREAFSIPQVAVWGTTSLPGHESRWRRRGRLRGSGLKSSGGQGSQSHRHSIWLPLLYGGWKGKGLWLRELTTSTARNLRSSRFIVPSPLYMVASFIRRMEEIIRKAVRTWWLRVNPFLALSFHLLFHSVCPLSMWYRRASKQDSRRQRYLIVNRHIDVG